VSTIAEVRLWGKTIGAVSLPDQDQVAAFEYDAAFARSGIPVAPLTMPLSRRVYRFPELSQQTFLGLPGLLADSLPDKFGNALIDAWLASQGRRPDSFSAVERLCYTGQRGMGALEFAPAIGPVSRQATDIAIGKLVALASRVLTHRNNLQTSFEDQDKAAALRDILRVGTSAGGARAKAVIAWNPDTQEVRSGQIKAGDGFEYWLLKFDGVSGNKDKELEDPRGYGAIEYAYYLMAIDAGIDMMESRLMRENGRAHFMTRRFDRLDDGQKLHMQTLCALGHFDFNLPGGTSYEQAFLTCDQLGLGMRDKQQLFMRMVFNVLAYNRDDHTKQIAFLMDKAGKWRLSPAYDMTYAYNPSGEFTSRHQMTVNRKREDIGSDDFIAVAKRQGLNVSAAKRMIESVKAVLENWCDYADKATVESQKRNAIAGLIVP